MKTLIFNGSPRRQGDTAAMIQMLSAQLKGEVTVINAYETPIRGCVDCRYCFTHDRCAFPDFQETDDQIRAADNILIASPVFFNEITGELLKILSKVQVYWSAVNLRHEQIIPKPKKGGLILAYAGQCVVKYPEHSARILLKMMRVEQMFPTVVSSDTDRIPAKDDPACRQALMELAAFLNGSEPEKGES